MCKPISYQKSSTQSCNDGLQVCSSDTVLEFFGKFVKLQKTDFVMKRLYLLVDMSNNIVCFLVPGIMQLLSNLSKPELNLKLNLELHGIQCKLFKFTRLNIRVYFSYPRLSVHSN